VKLQPVWTSTNPSPPRWQALLIEAGYIIEQVVPAYTQRYGGLHNADKRAEYEVVVVAHSSPACSGPSLSAPT
jgi:hypothetical protein